MIFVYFSLFILRIIIVGVLFFLGFFLFFVNLEIFCWRGLNVLFGLVLGVGYVGGFSRLVGGIRIFLILIVEDEGNDFWIEWRRMEDRLVVVRWVGVVVDGISLVFCFFYGSMVC